MGKRELEILAEELFDVRALDIGCFFDFNDFEDLQDPIRRLQYESVVQVNLRGWT